MSDGNVRHDKFFCQYCGANALTQTVEECVGRIRNCNNCRVDITLNGTWSGIGANIMQKLIKYHGLPKVERLYFAKR